jgi:hypothetical protein
MPADRDKPWKYVIGRLVDENTLRGDKILVVTAQNTAKNFRIELL